MPFNSYPPSLLLLTASLQLLEVFDLDVLIAPVVGPALLAGTVAYLRVVVVRQTGEAVQSEFRQIVSIGLLNVEVWCFYGESRHCGSHSDSIVMWWTFEVAGDFYRQCSAIAIVVATEVSGHLGFPSPH